MLMRVESNGLPFNGSECGLMLQSLHILINLNSFFASPYCTLFLKRILLFITSTFKLQFPCRDGKEFNYHAPKTASIAQSVFICEL